MTQHEQENYIYQMIFTCNSVIIILYYFCSPCKSVSRACIIRWSLARMPQLAAVGSRTRPATSRPADKSCQTTSLLLSGSPVLSCPVLSSLWPPVKYFIRVEIILTLGYLSSHHCCCCACLQYSISMFVISRCFMLQTSLGRRGNRGINFLFVKLLPHTFFSICKALNVWITVHFAVVWRNLNCNDWWWCTIFWVIYFVLLVLNTLSSS